MAVHGSAGWSRRGFLAAIASTAVVRPGAARAAFPAVDATFIFASDVHACLVSADALSPNCAAEGKTDANLLKHVAALNAVDTKVWPAEIDGRPTGLAGAGMPIATPLGIVMGGDMTDDGGGQVKVPGEGHQLMQYASRYQQGVGPDTVHVPVYDGLGNHDLDQDGAPPHPDWYRRELRDFVELNHRSTVFYKPPVPVADYDTLSDNYSWDWGGLHLVQLQRFGGDTRKGAVSGLDWLKADLAQTASDGRPVVLFQHYGWDAFSTERWDPARNTFDDEGAGDPHWWSEAERAALIDAVKGYNVVGIFHGHEHPTPMIYRHAGIDIVKPVASFLGGFALVRVTNAFMDIALATAKDGGGVEFTTAFGKRFS
ncbi:metallophosphoesterase [Ensifer soli]|uniref:metallophosphoesterase n=1 Tax=Ciceribacter sp. sgz301302 TaxID=3342379 RepID=UPI0035B85C52